jgi:hypothetical protein
MLTPVEKNERSPSQNKKQLGEKRNLNQINDTARSGGKIETRVFQPVKPIPRKSFMESSKFQESKNDAQAEDPNYFYDNTSAMELDPVRSQVSKENYDNSAAEGDGPIPTSDNLFEGEISN